MELKNTLYNLNGVELRIKEPLKNYTTFNIGGEADFLVFPKTEEGIKSVYNVAKTFNVPLTCLGEGSNVLISDSGVKGIVLSMKKYRNISENDGLITALSGTTMGELIRYSIDNSLTGLEEFCGIPASVGGMTVMNAGAFNKSFSDIIVKVKVLENGEFKILDKSSCGFNYRESSLRDKIVLSTTLKLKGGIKEDVLSKLKFFCCERKARQPMYRTCGSVFKNPKGLSSGKLIEETGLKGLTVGGARISDKHANFIVCGKNATSFDVYNLIQTVKEKVKEKFKVELIEEVKYVGDFK